MVLLIGLKIFIYILMDLGVKAKINNVEYYIDEGYVRVKIKIIENNYLD